MLYTRQTLDPHQLTKNYRRIVSLVPSQTELLFDLGLDVEVAGITTFCIHPQTWFKNKYRIGGTKKVHFDRIDQINPDLIIANKEENQREQIEALAEKYTVWLTDVNNLTEANQMILDIGVIVNREDASAGIVENIEKSFADLAVYADVLRGASVAYFIWQNPFMVAAKETFIDDMLAKCGWKNAYDDLLRYPVLNESGLKEGSVELVFLSSEPYPFAQKHVPVFEKLFPNARIVLVDGEMFSWYGSRLQSAPQYFRHLIGELR